MEIAMCVLISCIVSYYMSYKFIMWHLDKIDEALDVVYTKVKENNNK